LFWLRMGKGVYFYKMPRVSCLAEGLLYILKKETGSWFYLTISTSSCYSCRYPLYWSSIKRCSYSDIPCYRLHCLYQL